LLDNLNTISSHNTLKTAKNIVSYAKKITDDFHELFASISNSSISYFYSSTPDLQIRFLGIESILNIRENGPNRVSNTSEKIEKLNLNHITNFHKHELLSIPLFLGGMKFTPDTQKSLWNDYDDSEWFIPKFLLYEINEELYIIYNYIGDEFTEQLISQYENDFKQLLTQKSKNGAEEFCGVIESNYDNLDEKLKWISQVSTALDQIKNNKFHKIVLSRQVDLKLNCYPNFKKLLSRLEKSFPKCYIFAFHQNDSTFFGASPEKLAKVMNGWVEADALAGSIRRGDNEEEDQQLENELLSSEKNLNEQKAVVEFISNSFKDFAEEIIFNERPIIRKLPNIQHLWTPIRAKLKSGKSILSLLKDIHPTPAICGVPWNDALVSIQQMESHSRGLFAGMVGWFNLENEGEFAVAIRSALYKNKQIHALAGCGIVEGSDPELEYKEAELKLRPILSLFKNEEIYQP
jgi:menaquinone-specific isochorismate synthase